MKRKIKMNQKTGNDILWNIKQAVNILLQPYGFNLDDLLEEREEESPDIKYLAINKIEKQYSIGRFTLYRAIKAQKIQAVKLTQAKSGKILVDVKSLERWLKSGRLNSVQQ